jgi:hypothetical protein
MMFKQLHAPAIVIAGALILAGCAENSVFGGSSSNLSTASIVESPKADPACTQLAAQIDALRKEGVADKVQLAAANKKTKLTPADLVKADQLNKTNAEFQNKCAVVKPTTGTQAAIAPATLAPAAPVGTPAATPLVAKKVSTGGIAQEAAVAR